jgi:hypothetical protein
MVQFTGWQPLTSSHAIGRQVDREAGAEMEDLT